MRLTVLCLFKQKWPGNIFTGKNRYVPKVTHKAMEQMRTEYARQEQVMLLLRHSYLSKEESSGHAIALNKPILSYLNMREQKRLRALKPHIRIEDRLEHLTIRDGWD